MECIPLYLNAQAVGILVCPQCGAQRTVNLRQRCPQVLTIVGEKRATITCRCGAVFQVLVDMRGHPRKAVQLHGALIDPKDCTLLSAMVIRSLSVQGFGGLLVHQVPLQHGEIYTTRFHLDDAERSLVHEPIIIRRLQGPIVGAEFYPPEQYHSALDFYVYGADLLPPLRPVPPAPHARDEVVLL